MVRFFLKKLINNVLYISLFLEEGQFDIRGILCFSKVTVLCALRGFSRLLVDYLNPCDMLAYIDSCLTHFDSLKTSLLSKPPCTHLGKGEI